MAIAICIFYAFETTEYPRAGPTTILYVGVTLEMKKINALCVFSLFLLY